MYYNINNYYLLNIFHVSGTAKHFYNGNDVNNNNPLLHAYDVLCIMLTAVYVLTHMLLKITVYE